MDDSEKPKMFRTLRGFLDGQEADGPNYFYFSATLRIHGDALPFEQIGQALEALWAVVRPAIGYLKGLKLRCKVNVFCGYWSNCDTAGFEVPHTCLELFTALEVPFGVSVIIA